MKVTEAPGARDAIVSEMVPDTSVWPFPLQTKLVIPVGALSDTPTLDAVDGPALLTVIV